MAKKRSTRRDRRPPARRPVPLRATHPSVPTPSDVAVPGMLPKLVGDGMYPMLLDVPVDAVPLYAALAPVHDELAGRPAGTCVTTCSILAEGLGHLGFAAECVAACATVHHGDGGEFADVGVWRNPPVVRPDGTTDGHMVVWASTFKRLVDPTIAQAPALLAAAHSAPEWSLPSVLPFESYDALLRQRMVTTVRPPYVISWTVFPEWTSILSGMLTGHVREAVDHAAIKLSHEVVRLMQIIAERRDLRAIHSLYPRLADLLTGRRQLPEVPPVSAAAAALLGLPSGAATSSPPHQP